MAGCVGGEPLGQDVTKEYPHLFRAAGDRPSHQARRCLRGLFGPRASGGVKATTQRWSVSTVGERTGSSAVDTGYSSLSIDEGDSLYLK